MKTERLLEIIGDIDSDFILEAEPENLIRKHTNFAAYAAMAAGFIALFVIGTAVLKTTLNSPGLPPNTEVNMLSGAAENTDEEKNETSGVNSVQNNKRGMQSEKNETAEGEAAPEAVMSEDYAGVSYPRYILNDTASLELSADAPNRKRIEELLAAFDSKPKASQNEFDHTPVLTVIEADGTKHEYGDSVTSYPQPDYEGAPSVPDDVSYYERTTAADGSVTTRYFEADADVGEFRKLIREAVNYEYEKLGNITGAVYFKSGQGDKTNVCIYSEDYGYMSALCDDADNVVVGDTAEIQLLPADDKNNSQMRGMVTNITQNDVTKTSALYLDSLSFDYEVLTCKGDKSFGNRLEMCIDKEELDFILDLNADKIPKDTLSYIKNKYDSAFFNENVLMYCNTESKGSVTAAVHAKWVGEPNIVYFKQGEPAPSGMQEILLVSIPKSEWDERVFEFVKY